MSPDRIARPRGSIDVDVLYPDVDCAELSILDGLGIRHRLLIVEYHPEKGITRGEVTDAMAALGYEVAETDPSSPEVVGTRE